MNDCINKVWKSLAFSRSCYGNCSLFLVVVCIRDDRTKLLASVGLAQARPNYQKENYLTNFFKSKPRPKKYQLGQARGMTQPRLRTQHPIGSPSSTNGTGKEEGYPYICVTMLSDVYDNASYLVVYNFRTGPDCQCAFVKYFARC